jgi:threonine/homoserine/homoserine lactone efflux protein
MKFDEKLTKLITRALVAAYLIYLGYKIITSSSSTNSWFLLTVIGIIFLIAAVAFGFYMIRQFIVSKKSPKE